MRSTVIVAVNTRTYHFWPVVVESGVVTQQVSRYTHSLCQPVFNWNVLVMSQDIQPNIRSVIM